jgi:hypothetical protein
VHHELLGLRARVGRAARSTLHGLQLEGGSSLFGFLLDEFLAHLGPHRTLARLAKEEARRELDYLEGARGDGDRKRVRQPLDALVEELESVGRQSALSHCAERRVDAASRRRR